MWQNKNNRTRDAHLFHEENLIVGVFGLILVTVEISFMKISMHFVCRKCKDVDL